MYKTMTPEREREIDELRAGITPGEWIADDNEGYGIWSVWAGSAPSGNVLPRRLVAQCPGDDAEPYAAFIAAAPQIVDEQKAEIEALRIDYFFEKCRVSQLEGEVVVLNEHVGSKDAEIEALRAENARMRGRIADLEFELGINAEHNARIAAASGGKRDLLAAASSSKVSTFDAALTRPQDA